METLLIVDMSEKEVNEAVLEYALKKLPVRIEPETLRINNYFVSGQRVVPTCVKVQMSASVRERVEKESPDSDDAPLV